MPPAAIYLDHNATAPILPEVADAVREAARPRPEPTPQETGVVEVGRRGHLRVLRTTPVP